MTKWGILKLQEFLSLHPQMRLTEYCDEQVVVEGDYLLNAQMDGYDSIQGVFRLRIIFPDRYPRELPIVSELDGRIPRHMDYHTYTDGSFCLGSVIKLKNILFDSPTALDLVEQVITPFLYNIVYKLKYGVVPSGELDHGEKGLIYDYQRLFNVKGKYEVLQVLKALGRRKREANKLLCPCGCGGRIGKCNYRLFLQQWRRIEKRRWFKKHLSEFTPIEKDKKKTGSRAKCP